MDPNDWRNAQNLIPEGTYRCVINELALAQKQLKDERQAETEGRKIDYDDTLERASSLVCLERKVHRLQRMITGKEVVVPKEQNTHFLLGNAGRVRLNGSPPRTLFLDSETPSRTSAIVMLKSAVGQKLYGMKAGEVRTATLADGRKMKIEVEEIYPPTKSKRSFFSEKTKNGASVKQEQLQTT